MFDNSEMSVTVVLLTAMLTSERVQLRIISGWDKSCPPAAVPEHGAWVLLKPLASLSHK